MKKTDKIIASFYFYTEQHVMVGFVPFLELKFGTSYRLPSAHWTHLSLLNGFLSLYGIFSLYLGLVHNFFVYPVTAQLSWPQRIVFFAFYLALSTALYFVGVAAARCRCCWSCRRVRGNSSGGGG